VKKRNTEKQNKIPYFLVMTELRMIEIKPLSILMAIF